MKLPVWFHPDAEAEINEAANFLDKESPGLGDVFFEDLERAIQMIMEHPEVSPVLQGRVRRKILSKFPYSIMYSVASGKIRILAVSHQRRRPFYWRYRC